MLKQDKFENFLKKGYKHLQKGELIQSKEEYLKALAIEPEDIVVLNNLTQIYSMLHDENKSKGYGELLLKACDKELKYRKTEDTLILKSNAQMVLDKKNEANETFDEILKINPENYIALYQKAIYLEQEKQPEKALEYIERILKTEKSDIASLLAKGRNLSMLKKYEKAEECFNRVFEIDPKNKGAIIGKSKLIKSKYNYTLTAHDLMYLAVQFWENGKFKIAYKNFKVALSIDDSYSEIWFAQGELLIRMGKITKAIQSFEKAFELNPQTGRIVKKKKFFKMLNRMKKINILLGYEKEKDF